MRTLAQRIHRRHLLRGAVIGSTSTLFLAACGGDSDSEGSSGSTTNTGSSTTTSGAAQKEPVRGGTLSFSIGGDPPSFDMITQSTYLVSTTMAPVYNQLVRFDPNVAEEPPEAVEGDLAKSWELTSDGLRYTFKLHEGVTFHDGKPFTAADVKASLERMKDPPGNLVSPRQSSLQVIDKLETPDTTTLVMTLKRPAPSMLPILAQGWMSIYSAQDIANNFDFKLKTNGTGPFKLKDYTRGNKITLDANPNYFVQGLPYLAAINIFIQVDAGSALSAFQSGQTNFNFRFTEAEIESIQPVMGNKITSTSLKSLGFGSVNFGHRAPWTDERVRRAMSLGIDRQESIDLLYEGKGFIGGYMPGGGAWALTEEELEKLPGYARYSDKTVAEAKQLLAAAGIKEGFETTLLTRRGQSFENLSVFLKDQYTRIGIDARPQVTEDAGAYEALDTRNFDLAPWSHGISLDDPDTVFGEFYLTDSVRNYSGLGSPEVDALFNKQSQTLDLTERKKLVKEMQNKAIPLYGKLILSWSSRRVTQWSTVQGYTPHGNSYNNNRHDTTWVERS